MGIRYNIVKQEKGELFLIFPLAFHQDFNVGYNVVEAINFATKEWINPGLLLLSVFPEYRCNCPGEFQANPQLAKLVIELVSTGTRNLKCLNLENE